MKIGIFTDTYLPDVNGVVTSVELLRKILEENGHDAYVICTYKGINKVKKEGKIIRLPGVEIKKLYGYALTSPLHFLYIEELRSLNLDIIHAETEFGVGIFANIVASTLNLPLVRTYHTTYEDYTHYLNFINSKTLDKGLKKLVVKWSKLYCNNCVKLITPSKKTKDMLISYGVTTPIDIIPTGIELKAFRKENIDLARVKEIKSELNILADEKLLIYVGRIAKEKSIDKIIDAFKDVKKNGLKVKLLIVGDGPILNDLKKMVSDYALDDYVKFVGKKPFFEIPVYYHASDGFISASTSETQGMTYIEALASGLVVLAHYDEVLDDIVKENVNGFYFNNDDIYNTILKFDNLNDDVYQKMKENAVNSILDYDSDKFGSDSINLYKQAIEDYKYSYIISKTILNDNCVTLILKGFDGNEEKLVVSLDSYYELGLRNASKISKFNFDILKKMEVFPISYKSCLRKLTNRDYSIKEMSDYLKYKFNLNDIQIKMIIDKLCEKHLLDDYRYAAGKINSFRANFYSRKSMINKLEKAGISKEIIDKCLINEEDNEFNNAFKLANKYMGLVKNKSLNMKKKTIVAKLVNAGFSSDVANDVINALDFSLCILEENDILRKEALKALKKYERKYSGTDLRNKIYMSLASKGFSYDNIYALINEMEL